MSKKMLDALQVLEQQKGIPVEVMVETIQEALRAGYKREYKHEGDIEVKFDTEKGKLDVFAVYVVVEEPENPDFEITEEQAIEMGTRKSYAPGDVVKVKVTPTDFGRTAIGTVKQIVMQKFREAERGALYNEFSVYEKDLITGTVERLDDRYIYINLNNKLEAILSKKDQLPSEKYESHDKIKVFVYKVENTPKGMRVFVSRTHPDFIRRLFEQEVPEINMGDVDIKSVAREAGSRTKIAVASNVDGLDPIGTTVGERGSRVQAVIKELKGENIDIVEWRENPAEFIAEALKPAVVDEIIFDDENPNDCLVIVPDDKLSLAIGKAGQNARLAAKLTNHRIDIKSISQFQAYIAELESYGEEALDVLEDLDTQEFDSTDEDEA
ncbi:MAG: transcription termination factor NusA [Lactobacillales bacterium]|jgi:N utilization substance protein A|nr:transcription termination factor NusA [Lactobacillales bacterium]